MTAPSNLGRLLVYAKPTETDATENFTTEALGSLLRVNAGPLMRVLARQQRVPADAVLASVRTQTVLPGVGVIDLHLAVRGLTRQDVLVEVKVGSGESGDQLRRYRAYCDSKGATFQLVTLSGRYMESPHPHSKILWQDLWAQIVESDGSQWTDFKKFLEEIHMADSSLLPITARESSSIGDTGLLLRKLAVIFWQLIESWQTRLPDVWPAGIGYVRGILATSLASRGRLNMIVGTKGAPLFLYLGVGEHDDDAWLSVWLEIENRRLADQLGVTSAVECGDVPAGWSGRVDGPVLMLAERRLALLDGPDETLAWLDKRMIELQGAGYLAWIQPPHALDTSDEATPSADVPDESA
jgi:hypothetical protein